MEEVRIADIKWGDRGRQDYGDLEEMAQSLKAFGLIQAIVLDKENNLIAGGRRLAAAITLSWDKILVQRKEDIDPLRLRELELEENLRRKDLTWQEKAAMIEEIHDLKGGGEQNTETIAKTATEVKKTERTIYRNLKVAKALRTNPEIADAKDLKAAMTRVRRIEDKARRELVASEEPVKNDFLYHANALQILPKLADESVDLVILDPPYGTDIQNKTDRERAATWSWGGTDL